MTGRLALLSFLLYQLAASAAAQSVTLAPSNPRGWDAAVSVGWLGGNKEAIAEPWNEWYDTFATSVDVGRYWSTHFKTEVGATLTTEGSVYSQEQFPIAAQSFPAFFSRDHRYTMKALSLGAAYQFFENAWFHPHVAAGVDLTWETSREERAPTFFYDSVARTSRQLRPAAIIGPDVDLTARPFAGVGFKAYMTPRAFFRTDMRFVFRGGVDEVLWRFGFGMDF